MEAIATPAVPKRIALFSDGTGNSSAKAQKTNVWRLFQALDQQNGDQIAMYDDGVGTSSNKYLAILGGAFGWGLKRNVIDLYKYVCRNYRKGDDIYGFGFSRGAFTIRVLVGLIAREGLVPFRSEEELDHHAAAAYRSFRYKAFPSKSPIVWTFRKLRDGVLYIRNRIKGCGDNDDIRAATIDADRHQIPIRFLGLWDTVEAYGMPITQLKRGIDWVIWPMLFGDMKLSPNIQRAVHALSLDDERETFHPLLWDELWEAELAASDPAFAGRITQVWFAGVHSNVGGGYPEDRLSLVPLEWIMGEAAKSGLTFVAGRPTDVTAEKSPYARLYDSRAGLAAYYRYSPRKTPILASGGIPILANVHWSVLMRMVYGTDSYAPITLPHNFNILTPGGALLKFDQLSHSLRGHGTLTTGNPDLDSAIRSLGTPDHNEVGLVWDTVFWRRCLYVLTMGLTLVAVAFPFFSKLLPSQLAQVESIARGPISTVVDALSGVIPASAGPWKKSLIQYQLEFGVVLIAIGLTLLGSQTLENRIHDRARLTWHRGPLISYREWRKERHSGFGRLIVFCLVLLGAAWIVAPLFDRADLRIGIGLTAALLLLGWGLSVLGNQDRKDATATRVRSTVALKVARLIRENKALIALYSALSERVFPLGFAFLLIIAGLLFVNRAAFDTLSSAGLYCGKPNKEGGDQAPRKSGDAETFTTDNLCWASGVSLKKDHRYLITLTTPDQHATDRWFDRDVPTDVTGFATDSLRHWYARPLTRWWNQNWFKPIARIGRFGNDEYVLDPIDDVAPAQPPCPDMPHLSPGLPIRTKIGEDLAKEITKCVPLAADRVVLHSEIKAKSDGELFLYVNDAVLAIPRLYNLFFANNSGSTTLRVEPLTSRAVAAEQPSTPVPQP